MFTRSRFGRSPLRMATPVACGAVDLYGAMEKIARLRIWLELTGVPGSELFRDTRIEVHSGPVFERGMGMIRGAAGYMHPGRRVVRINPLAWGNNTRLGVGLTLVHELVHVADTQRVTRYWPLLNETPTDPAWHGERFQRTLLLVVAELFGRPELEMVALRVRGADRSPYAMDAALRRLLTPRRVVSSGVSWRHTQREVAR